MSKVSPVTLYDRESENFNSLFDMPGFNIVRLEPVSTIKSLLTPSILTEKERKWGSNATETVDLMSAFTNASMLEQLSSFTPFCRFPNYTIIS
jgi:hypothetical protein